MLLDIVKNYELRGNDNALDCITGWKKYGAIYRKHQDKKRVYFIGLPEHGNLGDHAIALGMERLLYDWLPEYDVFTIKYGEVLMQMPLIRHYIKAEDMIVLIGGGNMGVEYFFEEELRRLVISYFPNNKIVIFPQTIDFGDSDYGKSELKKTQKIYNDHKNLHLFARESHSFEMMKTYFSSVDVHLAPDIVNYYRFSEKTEERKGVLLCLRSDKETALSGKVFAELLQRFRSHDISYESTDTVFSYVPDIMQETIRKQLVENKLRQFARAKIVVTDRLHGMIFSVITKTPCVVFGNYNHKVKSSYETWYQSLDSVSLAENIEEAWDGLYTYWSQEEDGELPDFTEEFRRLIDVLEDK